MNPLHKRYSKEIDQILDKYPEDQKRSAVMPLLYIAQREAGYVSREEMEQIGEILSITATEVASIVGFYTLYHDHPEGKYRIQVCNDLPCAMRGADDYLNALCDRLGVQPGETTEDGVITVEAVMCLAACDKAPMFQSQSSQGIAYHENQSVDSTMQQVEKWRQESAA